MLVGIGIRLGKRVPVMRIVLPTNEGSSSEMIENSMANDVKSGLECRVGEREDRCI